MSESSRRCVLISDFNIGTLAGCLPNEPELEDIKVDLAPFGQVTSALINDQSDLWHTPPELTIVWTRPEGVIDAFRDLLGGGRPQLDQILGQVDEYAAHLLRLRERSRIVVVPSWVPPGYHRGWGPLDMKPGLGVANTLMRMNLRLADALNETHGFFVLDSQRWVGVAGRAASHAKLWHLAKVPFANDVFKEAARDVAALMAGVAGRARKLVVVDLDDTLWGGTVGDVGWQQLRVGGHDPVGEAHASFQSALRSLARRGVLLAIVSKNDEATALEALREHPEMVLRPDDFVAWRINWRDKAANIADMVADLNLLPHSVVFIDDNPVERARVREALPEVFVPEWPDDRLLYTSTLHSLRCFDVVSISQEDAERTQQYASERDRRHARIAVGSLEEWLQSLETTVTVEPLNRANLARTAQLLNKTNQMNLSTRRLTENDLVTWVAAGNHLWTIRVSDRFGDAGLTGILSVQRESNQLRIVDFVLSCRVMGRQVEETMLFLAVDHARALGVERVIAECRHTPKNKPCLEFLKRSWPTDQVPARFVWDTNSPYPVPPAVRLNVLTEQSQG